MNTKNIITIVGLILIFVCIGIGAYFVLEKTSFFAKPNPLTEPKKIKITNISHDKFTISWITDVPTQAQIIYGQNNKYDQSQVDDSYDSLRKSKNIHHITVSNLEGDREYNFKIKQNYDGKDSIFDNQGQPFLIKTASRLTTKTESDLINGIVVDDTGKPAIDAIVFIDITGAQAVSTQVKKDGSFLINLSNTRTKDLRAWTEYDLNSTQYNILIQGKDKNSTALVLTANDSPVPQITLGQTYDFTKDNLASLPKDIGTDFNKEATSEAKPEILPLSPLKQEEASDSALGVGGEKIPEQLPITQSSVEISYPEVDFEEIAVAKPKFIGTGPADRVLNLSIEGPIYVSTTVTVDSLGDWEYTSAKTLTDGDYVLTVDFMDDEGQEFSETKNFTIAVDNTNNTPAFSASESAKASPTPIARSSMPSTSSGVPTSGLEMPTLFMLLLGIGLIFSGYGWRKYHN